MKLFKEYRTLLPYWKQHIMKYLLGFLFLFVTDMGQLYLPQLIRAVIDHLSLGEKDLSFVTQKMILMVGIAIFIAVGRFGWRFFIHGASRRIERDLRQRYFEHLLTQSSTFYGKHKVGDLMARATSDMDHIRMASGMGFVALFDGLFMTLFIVIILFTQYPSIAPLVLIPFPFVTLLVLGIGPLLGKYFKAVQEGYASLSEHVQEAISGIRVIKSFSQEKDNLFRFSKKNKDYKERNLSLVKLWGFFFPLIAFLSGLASLLLLRFGGFAVLDGRLTTGDFVAAFTYLEMLVWPMLGAGFTVNLLQHGGASLSRINAIMNQEADIVSLPDAIVEKASGDIVVKNLTYSYAGSSEAVLKDVNVEIKAGTTLGILGRTGSGKTTFIKMLPRLLDPPIGSISIGGREVHDFDLSSLRASIGMVPQETFLFSASIEENIAFAHPQLSKEEIARAAAISTIDRDLNTIPGGMETSVGERGITLSGGQKQRIAISRAVVVHPDILVFDDALSSVDTATEEKILESFLDVRRGKTNILISHRVSTLQNADKIIVFEEGRISQEGSHQELIAAEGFYQEIYNLQKLEEETPRGGKA